MCPSHCVRIIIDLTLQCLVHKLPNSTLTYIHDLYTILTFYIISAHCQSTLVLQFQPVAVSKYYGIVYILNELNWFSDYNVY